LDRACQRIVPGRRAQQSPRRHWGWQCQSTIWRVGARSARRCCLAFFPPIVMAHPPRRGGSHTTHDEVGSPMRYSIKSGLPIAFATLGSSFVVCASAQDSAPTSLEEIVVTAQRREEKLADVPLSISAFSQENLDSRGVRSIDDIARLTPGVTFTRGDARNGQASTISIRGVASNAGASTTGIYIDD